MWTYFVCSQFLGFCVFNFFYLAIYFLSLLFIPEGEEQSQSDNEEQYPEEQGSDAVPPELHDLRQRLDFLKSIYQNSLAAVDAVREQEQEENNDEDEEQEENEDEEGEEEEGGAVGGSDLPPQAQLKDIHSKLNYLKNLYEMKDPAVSIM